MTNARKYLSAIPAVGPVPATDPRALELTDRGLPPLIARFVFDVGQTISTPVLLAGAALLRLRLPGNLTDTQLQTLNCRLAQRSLL